MKAAIYTRISQDRRGEGAGVARQEADCRALVERRGWELMRIFSDNNASAYAQKKRPEFVKLVEAANRREFDVIVAYSSDRLWRVGRDLEALVDLVEATGIEISTCVSGNVDLSTPDGRKLARVFGAMAQGESEKMAERIKREKADGAAAGQWGGGSRPYGYRPSLTVPRGLDVVPEEAAVIREMVSRVLAGERLVPILRDLNKRGVTTATGKPWRYRTAQQMLIGPLCTGLREHHDALHEGLWDPIISRDEWMQLRSTLSTKQPRGTVTRHLLTGLVCCADCGAKLDGHLRDGRKEYRASMGTVEPGCGRRIAGELDLFVVDAVLQLLGTHLAYFLPSPTITSRAPDLDKIRTDIEELVEDYYVHHRIPKSAFTKALEALERLQARAEAELAARVSTSPVEALRDRDPRAAWEELNFDQRRSILTAVVHRIEVRRAIPGRNKFDPTRVRLLTKPVRVGPKRPRPEPDEGEWIWDPTRGCFAHDGVVEAPVLAPLAIEARSTMQRYIPRARDQQPAVSAEAVGGSAQTPRFRRGPKAAAEAATDEA